MPVGEDQLQHIETTRDIAKKLITLSGKLLDSEPL